MRRWSLMAVSTILCLIGASAANAQTITVAPRATGKILGSAGPRLSGATVREEAGQRVLVGRVESNVVSDLAPACTVAVEARDAAGRMIWRREVHLTTRAPLRHSRLHRSADFRLTLPAGETPTDLQIDLSSR